MDTNHKHEPRGSNWGSELDQVHTAVCSNEYVEEMTAKDDNQYALEILKHVQVRSRKSIVKGIFKNSKEGDLDVNKDDQRKIEEQLKKAYAEFYQKLHLLKQYRYTECFNADCIITICCYLCN